jgi:hypothetical protein
VLRIKLITNFYFTLKAVFFNKFDRKWIRPLTRNEGPKMVTRRQFNIDLGHLWWVRRKASALSLNICVIGEANNRFSLARNKKYYLILKEHECTIATENIHRLLRFLEQKNACYKSSRTRQTSEAFEKSQRLSRHPSYWMKPLKNNQNSQN